VANVLVAEESIFYSVQTGQCLQKCPQFGKDIMKNQWGCFLWNTV